MPLTYDATKITNSKELHESPTERTKSAYLCFEMMRCGFGWEITQDNAPKLWKRVKVAQKVWGSILTSPEGEVPYTEADIMRRVGYSTNVPMVTDAKFAKSLMAD
jgi:hypothetical protein